MRSNVDFAKIMGDGDNTEYSFCPVSSCFLLKWDILNDLDFCLFKTQYSLVSSTFFFAICCC